MRYFFSLPFDTCCFPTCSCNLRLSLAPPLHCQLFWLCTTPRAFSTGPKVQRHPLLCAAYPVWTLCCTNMRSIPLQLQLNYTNKGREDNTTHNPSSSFILSICLFSHHPKSSLGVSVRSLLPITLCPPSLFFFPQAIWMSYFAFVGHPLNTPPTWLPCFLSLCAVFH